MQIVSSSSGHINLFIDADRVSWHISHKFTHFVNVFMLYDLSLLLHHIIECSSNDCLLSLSIILYCYCLLFQTAKSVNKEAEEEKRLEKEKQEKAIGLLTYLGQSSTEALGINNGYNICAQRAMQSFAILLTVQL